MDENKNIHKDHRKRLRKRFLNEGLEGFDDHNILELLLFYSIPRRDTNDLSHQLISRFGSLSAVFDANYDELISCKGISENSAVLLKLIPKLSRAYLLDKDTRFSCFSDPNKLGKYLVNYFIGEKNEKLLALFFTSRTELIDIAVISEGTVTATDVPVRRIAELGFSKNAAFIVLAHNHPDGTSTHSDEDISFTSKANELFGKLGMPIVEHFVIGASSFETIMGLDLNLNL